MLLLVSLLVRAASGAPPPCPDAAQIAVVVDNRSDDATLEVAVEGTLVDADATCAGAGEPTYTARLECTGQGVVRCGGVGGLRPGLWVHRFAVTVAGSTRQEQAQRSVLVAGVPGAVSNAVVWTAYPRTFVVGAADPAALRSALDGAAAFTASHAAPALVTFDRTVFPGAATPATIFLARGPHCAHETCGDSFPATLCMAGSRIVVDALDRDALPGAVVLSADTCAYPLLRVYGSDVVLRGVHLQGSRKPNPTGACQVDTLAMVGADARRNRLEQAIVAGPTCGDAVSVERDAADAVIVDSRITGAEDKGIKITNGGQATVARSCVHDNRNGGVQVTLGGAGTVRENVVQRNVPGSAQNGLSATGNGTPRPTTLATDGNVVRFSGGRGLSVTDDASATFRNDYVGDNQFAGSKVESTAAGAAGTRPGASFHGVAMVCNRHDGLSGTCSPAPGDVETACSTAADCCRNDDGTVDPACVQATTCKQGSIPRGFGAVVAQAAGRDAPEVSYGDAAEPGRNAFSMNRGGVGGANLKVTVDGPAISALANQWEHCGSGGACDVTRVTAEDIVVSEGAVTVGAPLGPRAGAPIVRAVSPARPARGTLVRVFGENFNAIEGNPLAVGVGADVCASVPACDLDGRCASGPCVENTCPCAASSTVVQDANRLTGANELALRHDGKLLLAFHPDAVTPTMLAFHMPVDCFAPLRLELSKRTPSGATATVGIPLCDPAGCAERAGEPCDDGDLCTTDDRCDDAGTCVPGPPLVCPGACAQCDGGSCVQRAAGAACDDGNACTTGDRCTPTGECEPGAPLACDDANPCTDDACAPASGCVHVANAAACDDGDGCTADVCAGGVCVGARGADLAWERCRVAALDASVLCAPDRVGAAFARKFTARVDRAGRLLERAAEARGAAKRARRVRAARRVLGGLVQQVRRAAPRLTPACVASLEAALRDGRALLVASAAPNAT
jgi:hypothetical protein